MTRLPRVAFDVTPVISGRTGIARYVNELGSALEAGGTELRRFAVGRRTFPLPAGAKHVRIPLRVVEAWWRVTSWPPIETIVPGSELVHATGFLTPATRRPLVTTVHDVAALRRPDLHPQRHVDQQRAQLRSLHRAAVILSVSAATADDLTHLGVASERIMVAPLGVSPPAEPSSETPRPAAPGYLLTVGETSPRKGYDVLLRALARLGSDVRLVMAGPPAGAEDRLASLIAELGTTSRVMRLGVVSEATLASLYADAVALCFPSVSEGFGLPVLEAMASGLPVLASDIAVMRELTAGAAILVPAGDGRAWSEAIEAVVGDPALRERLAAQGRRRAAGFTWERTAAATQAAYRVALGGAS